MKKISEAEKLTNYENAINKLPAEVQYEKVSAVKSPETIKRFLSEDAPDRLVRRFMHRVFEAIDDTTSMMERGRILFQLNLFDEAEFVLLGADKEGNKGAAYYLGLMYAKSGKVEEAADWLQKASEHESAPERRAMIMFAKSHIAELAGNVERAIKLMEQAYGTGQENRRFYSGHLNRLRGENERAVQEFAKGVGEDGSEICVDGLIDCALRNGYQEMLKYDSMRKMMMVGIERGDSIKYFELGMMDEMEGRDDAAAESYFRAALLGVPKAIEHLPRFAMKGKRMENIIAVAEKLFPKNAERVYSLMIMLFLKFGMFDRFLDYSDIMFQKGHRGLAARGVGLGMTVEGHGVMSSFVKGLSDGKNYSDELSMAVYKWARGHVDDNGNSLKEPWEGNPDIN